MIQWIITGVLQVVNWFIDVIHGLGSTLVAGLVATIQSAFPAVDCSSWLTLYGQINYFVPVSETITFALAYFAAWTAVGVYRFVKSWIPTVGN